MVQIPGRLTSIATERVVSGADEVFDDSLQKRQSEINAISIKGSTKVVQLTGDITANEMPEAGEQIDVVYVNDTAVIHTVGVSNSTYRTPDGGAIVISVPAGGYGELNFLNIGGTIYVRGL